MSATIYISTVAFGEESWCHSLCFEPSTNCSSISKRLIFSDMSSFGDITISEMIRPSLSSIGKRRIENIWITSSIRPCIIDPLKPCLSDCIAIYLVSADRKNRCTTSDNK